MKQFASILSFAVVVSIAGFVEAADTTALEKIGAKLKMQGGVITDLHADCKGWKTAEFQLVGKQTSLKSISLSGKTITAETLKLLAGLGNLESILFNNAQVSDEGFKHFQAFPKLKRLSLFHHARDLESFDGSGFVHLKPLTELKQLTHAGKNR